MDTYNIKVNGVLYQVEVEKVEGNISGTEVKTKTAGKVWKIALEQGSRILKGDTIMILEAMKMEIPVIAPEDGIIKKLLVSEGDSAESNQIVAIIG